MSWMLPTFGRILIANGLFPVVLKKSVGLPSRKRRFAVQFLFCVIFAAIIAFVFGTPAINTATLIILAIGFINGFAAYAQWNAYDISVSKTALFTFWDDIIAMGLSYFILNEGQYLKPGTYLGITMSLGAVIFFAVYSYWQARKSKDDSRGTSLRFFLYVGFYSLVWGVAIFLRRYFGVAGVPVTSFLLPWYSGAFLASIILVLAVKEKDKAAANSAFKIRPIAWMLALAVLIFASLGLDYIAYSMAPQNIVQPFFLVGEMVLPALIGLYLFSERKKFDKLEMIIFALAITGGIIIAFNSL